MIETVYRDNSKRENTDVTIRLPKNIRQIGSSNSDYQIYIEDNVMNYLKKVPVCQDSIRYGVLMGSVKYGYGYTYIFINGVVEVDEVIENTVIFSETIWNEINDNIRKYFSELKVVGWYCSKDFGNSADIAYLNRIHLSNFGGMDKVFLRFDREEDEETFYTYEETGLKRLMGYHIYFERNRNFDNYIIDGNRMEKFLYSPIESDVKKGILVRENAEKKIEGNAVKGRKSKNNVSENDKGLEHKNVIKAEGNVFGKIASNFATVLLAVSLIATTAVLANEDTVNKIKNKINSVIQGEKNEAIPVNGIVSLNETTENNTETLEKDNKEEDKKENEGEGKVEEFSNEESKNEKTKINETTASVESNSNEENKVDENSKANEVTTQTATQNAKQYDSINIEGTNSNDGQKVLEDSDMPDVKVEANVKPIEGVETSEYIVKEGDTLFQIIISRYGDDKRLDEIMHMNNLKNPDYVEAGQKLLLP